MSGQKLLEIACFSLPSALIAQAAGANRVELCEDYHSGGVTPSRELILQTRQQLQLPLHVMIRPRPGNFVYSVTELSAMQEEILFCKQQKINGVVFGVLTNGSEIDTKACQHLLEAARPMSVTFHRAIDSCRDMKLAIQELCRLGIDRVLTSGKSTTALEGLYELKILQKLFGRQIVIMPGGGIRSSNIRQLLASCCTEYHTSALTGGTDADATEIQVLKTLLKEAFPGD